MTTALYLEHYLDGLESLPNDLNRKFSEMRDLDTQTQNHLSMISGISARLDRDQYTITAVDRADEIQRVDEMFTSAKRLADEKVILAMETYECVDKHIRSLDADLLRFEMELKGISSRKETLQKINKGKAAGRKRKETSTLNDDENSSVSASGGVGGGGVGRKRKRKSQSASANNTSLSIDENHEPSTPLLSRSLAEASDVLDMPVDPNEPTYCICNQVSYGEMIGCDNADCPIEWFHFTCVTLPTKKQMKWFCPRCTVLRKKK